MKKKVKNKMIKYDYKIERDEHDVIKTYKPNYYPKELDNLVYIEGRNSTGKSTLLNLIAFGFHGLFKKNLNPILKEKLTNFIKDPDQRYSFNLNITDGDESYIINSEKPNADKEDIIVKKVINGKSNILTPDRIHRDFNLIYDIPDNPTDKLRQLTFDIKDKQTEVAHRIGAFRTYLIDLREEIKKGRDPEEIIKMEEQIKDIELNKYKVDKDLDTKKELYSLFLKYTLFKFFLEYSKQYSEFNNQINSIQKGKIKGRHDDIKYSHELLNINNQIEEKIGFLQFSLNSAISFLKKILPSEYKIKISSLEAIDVHDEINHPEIYNNIDLLSDDCIRLLNGLDNDEPYLNKSKEIQLLNEIIQLLKNYQTIDIIIPGIERNIKEFISILNDVVGRIKLYQ